MKCIDIKENLDAFADGEIEFSQKRKIENHLENCVSCKTQFAYLQTIGKSVKQNLQISAPAVLDEKVLTAFQTFHNEKRVEKKSAEKIGWFGIPRLAFAAGLILFALSVISAFQIGKMSADEISVVMPPVESMENTPANDEKNIPVKIIEIPVIREKIIKIPVIKTRTIYVEKDDKKEVRANAPAKDNFALKSSVENNGYFTRTNLKDFQPVSEFKFKINKEEKQNE